MSKNYLISIIESENGLDCCINYSGPPRRNIMIKNVHPNIVCCVIGESTLEYLKNQPQDLYCEILQTDIDDFKKHRVK